MKTITTITLCLAALASCVPGVNPERAVLFTLDEHEEIARINDIEIETGLESLVDMTSTGTGAGRFACVTKDTRDETFTLVFNGERVATTDDEITIYYLNVLEKNGYAIEYDLQNARYANVRGKVHGPYPPYTSLTFAMNERGGKSLDMFRYYKDGSYHVYHHGKKEGPYDNTRFLLPCPGQYAYAYRKNDKWYVNINGTRSRAHDDIGNLHLAANGNYIYSYEDNGQWHVNVNGTKSMAHEDIGEMRVNGNGQYIYVHGDYLSSRVNINGKNSKKHDDIRSVRLTGNGKYAFAYEDDDGWHANINGKESAPHDDVRNVLLAGNGNHAFLSYDDGEWHVNINGKESRPYDAVGYLRLDERGKHAYCYKENGLWSVNINGKESRPHDDVESLLLARDGKYAYTYDDDGQWFVNINGKESRARDDVESLILVEDGKHAYEYEVNNLERVNINGMVSGRDLLPGLWINYREELVLYSVDGAHSFLSTPRRDYVVIDGKQHGRSPALGAWYEERDNTFTWCAIEERQLVAYRYKCGKR
ncbi:MAG: hypothetical protein LBF09_05900 [Odoribacteraceae bacterium]|jgi:hypothetical protein|nr:hypothetical protein [Odoribacteraceae bacterium]